MTKSKNKLEITDAGLALLSAWNAASSEQCMAALEQLLADAMTYRDPHLPGLLSGRHQYLDYVARVRAALPALRFEPLPTAPDGLVERISWRLRISADSPPSQGMFIWQTDVEGRIKVLEGAALTNPNPEPQPASS